MQAPPPTIHRVCPKWSSILIERAARWGFAASVANACLVVALAQPHVPQGAAKDRKMTASSGWRLAQATGDHPAPISPVPFTRTFGMTRLLTFRFDEGRPRLSPEEEATIRTQVLSSDPQGALRNPASAVVAVGYVDHAVDHRRSRQVAFRRAQIIVDLLRDGCGVNAAIQVVMHPAKDLPASERRGKERLVEVWFTAP